MMESRASMANPPKAPHSTPSQMITAAKIVKPVAIADG
jgi:hypothetical protein